MCIIAIYFLELRIEMDFNKIRSNCRIVRIVVGLILVGYGIFTFTTSEPNSWFFLGIVPIIAGITNFCPLCLITKKCDI